MYIIHICAVWLNARYSEIHVRAVCSQAVSRMVVSENLFTCCLVAAAHSSPQLRHFYRIFRVRWCALQSAVARTRYTNTAAPKHPFAYRHTDTDTDPTDRTEYDSEFCGARRSFRSWLVRYSRLDRCIS